jgi:hypothetical protein
MLELQHQFAIKVKRGRHRLAEKALQKSRVKSKSSKKTAVEQPIVEIQDKKRILIKKHTTEINTFNKKSVYFSCVLFI